MDNFILNEGNIAYEDDYLLIIDKPAGMLVHPTVNEWGCTLYDYVTEYYARKNITANIHPVSRLDRHTSGLVIFAKEPIIQHWLSQQQMDKEYLEDVWSKMLEGEIDVLVCTTIIETGLDVPNVNTIILEDFSSLLSSNLDVLSLV